MKKLIALALCAVMLCLCFASCGKEGPSGTYVCEMAGMTFSTLTFKGDKVKNEYVSGNVSEGTFKYEDGKITCEYDSGTNDTFDYDADADEISLAGMVWKKK